MSAEFGYCHGIANAFSMAMCIGILSQASAPPFRFEVAWVLRPNCCPIGTETLHALARTVQALRDLPCGPLQTLVDSTQLVGFSGCASHQALTPSGAPAVPKPFRHMEESDQ